MEKKVLVFNLVIVSIFVILSFIGFWIIYKIDRHPRLLKLPSDVYAVWDVDSMQKNEMIDPIRGYNATSFNVEITDGHSGKAGYLNGKDSYIQTPLNFQGWKGITISFWVKPEDADRDGLSVILDNGHTANSDFAIQSADTHGENWVWHCNGIDIFLIIPLKQWSHVVVSADAKKGVIKAYIDGLKVGERQTDIFEFGPAMLTIGKLSKADDRYFRGSIRSLKIWDKSI